MFTAQKKQTDREKYFVATQWQLMRRKFAKHRIAVFGGVLLALFYVVGLASEFLSPYGPQTTSQYLFCPPRRVHLLDATGKLFHVRPFVYGIKQAEDPETWQRIYTEDKDSVYPIRFFARGESYKFWGLFPTNLHFFGVQEPGKLFLFGTDELGRDLFTRNLYAIRISLSIGLVGVALSFVLGCLLGGISGYYGGTVDMAIQRLIEFLIAIPKIPLWMALGAALPRDWSPIKIYFGITVILSSVGWTGLARVVRGKVMSVREEDFVMSAKISGATDGTIIRRHLLPSFLSYLIVNVTLAIPLMILAETSLSFLGIGLRPPVVSWGVLLSQAQNIQTIALTPWLLIPGFFVIVVVLSFNTFGDGLRDAADPYR